MRLFSGFRHKNKSEKFQVGFFDKQESFPFAIVRVLDKSSNVPSNTVYYVICAKSLSKARGSNHPDSNPDSLSTAT